MCMSSAVAEPHPQEFPGYPRIPLEDGVFDPATQEAVRVFQQVFNMPVTGVVDKATWYRIKEIYTSVKKLADLYSEGIRLDEAELLYPGQLTVGDTGLPVTTIQYYLNAFAYFNPYIPAVPIDGIYSSDTAAAVEVFQRQYGLDPTGITDRETWYKMQEVLPRYPLGGGYGIRRSETGDLSGLSAQPGAGKPGCGESPALSDLYLPLSAEIPLTEVTGYFGTKTEGRQSRAFQEAVRHSRYRTGRRPDLEHHHLCVPAAAF